MFSQVVYTILDINSHHDSPVDAKQTVYKIEIYAIFEIMNSMIELELWQCPISHNYLS
jgi:hypothetical protein